MRALIYHLAMVLMLLTPIASRGQDMLHLYVDVQDGSPTYTLNSKPISEERLREVLGKLGQLSDSQMLLIAPTARVTASDLLVVLLIVKDAGLHTVLISSAAKWKGKDGTIKIAVDLTRAPLQINDVGPGFTSRFETESPIELQETKEPVEQQSK